MALGTVVLAAMVAVASGGVGCAAGDPAEFTPEVDPNLPSVDVGNDPQPAPAAKPGTGTAAKDAGTATIDSGTSSTSSSSSGGSTSSSSSGGSTSSSSSGGSTSSSSSGGTVAVKPLAGEVMISEVMYDTIGTEPLSEWIEIYSGASVVRTLSGLTIKDGSARTHVIGSGVTIDPGAYVVLARNKASALASKVPAGSTVYEYGTGVPDTAGVLLANGSTGGVALLNGSAVLASVPYGGWYTQAQGGSSIQIRVLDVAQSTAKASWCLSQNAWTAGSEKGTPGATNDCL